MPSKNFSNTFVKKVKVPIGKNKITYFDIEEIGLSLEVRVSGNKTYYYRYNQDGKTYQKKIADESSINLQEARKLVSELKRTKERSRPITINNTLNTTNVSITLEEFWQRYYLPFITIDKKSYKTYTSFFYNHILPYFGKLPMSKLTSLQISKHQADLITTYKLQKSTANKFTIYLSTAYKKAIEWKIDFVTTNPFESIREYKLDNKIENYLNEHEIKRLLETVDAHPNELNMSALIRFYLFTGARRNEALKASTTVTGFELGGIYGTTSYKNGTASEKESELNLTATWECKLLKNLNISALYANISAESSASDSSYYSLQAVYSF